MTFKARINPATGKAETYTDHNEDAAKEKLERTRRELRDMLSGNAQFHADPLAAPPKPADPPEPERAPGAPYVVRGTGAPAGFGVSLAQKLMSAFGWELTEVIWSDHSPCFADPLGQHMLVGASVLANGGKYTLSVLFSFPQEPLGTVALYRLLDPSYYAPGIPRIVPAP